MSSVSSQYGFRERWLHRFAVLVLVATFVLLALGGQVTSKGVGMAVPDWPQTFGHNMFLFPVRLWHAGIRDEHVHRLVASGVGFLTIALAVCIQVVDRRRWLRRLGWTTLALVVAQGVLGGTRVTQNSVSVFGIPGAIFFGVLHAATAQVFLCFVGGIVLFTSRLWQRREILSVTPRVRRWAAVLTGVILAQLLVAATMRHQHAGLAIPDFPLAYGHLYPPTDADFIASVNQRRLEVVDFAPITAFQIHLQMLHRLLAVLIVAGVWSLGFRLMRTGGPAARWGMLWSGLILVQFLLGAATVWTNKAVDLATAHVVCGAASLLTGVLFSLRLRQAKLRVIEDNACPTPGSFLNPISAAAGAAVPSWRPTR